MNHGWLHTIRDVEGRWTHLDVVTGNNGPVMFFTAGRSETVQGPSKIPETWELESIVSGETCV